MDGTTMTHSAYTQNAYINTIPPEQQPAYPGDLTLEGRIEDFARWNAMAMVVRANRSTTGIGGHIASYASVATLLEVGFNHFYRGRTDAFAGDMVFFQGHTAPGIYARAFLEGRISEEELAHFRKELAPEGGLPSYPHPWLLPDFWQFPTVSMGLGPINSIYQARFIHYLNNRGLLQGELPRVWTYIGDGESDEPEVMGAIAQASRDRLDNLIWVVNGNLQRLDGPVRGNGQILRELEGQFRGAGWNVIKCFWGSGWDPLFASSGGPALAERLGGLVDGALQRLAVESADVVRDTLFGGIPELAPFVDQMSDVEIKRLILDRGGLDPVKVHAAYRAAVDHQGSPTVILAMTIKGFGMAEAGEGRNTTHQQKKLDDESLWKFRAQFNIPIADEDVSRIPFYRPCEQCPEMEYLYRRRKALGGFVPARFPTRTPVPVPAASEFAEFQAGSGGRPISTTMAFVRLLAKLLKDKALGPRIVPIIPDEARTFGMDALFREYGIFSVHGQQYTPVDAGQLMYYREAVDGQILEEGITEAGAMASFIAAGTAGANLDAPTIPFYTFYSMFGFQRVWDLIWAAGDSRAKGFLLGATAGRTTLSGEGLQHQDGNSQLAAITVPNLEAYDPAFAYEMAAVVRHGLTRMLDRDEDVIFYVTLYNENYVQPPIPAGVDPDELERQILRGLYRFLTPSAERKGARVNLIAAGSILPEALRAAVMLETEFDLAVTVYSMTSAKALYRDAISTERWNRLHPLEAERRPYVAEAVPDGEVTIVASDFVTLLQEGIARWLPGRVITLGTDGYGRSDDRGPLRDFFEVDAKHIAAAALSGLVRTGKRTARQVEPAMRAWGIQAERPDPWTV